MLENFWIYLALSISSILNIIIPISGSATVTPLLAILTDPHKAVGIASAYFLLSGIIRIFMFQKEIQWKYVKSLLPVSFIFAGIGALTLLEIEPKILLIIILIFSVYFLYKKFKQVLNNEINKPSNKFSIHLVGSLSGFLQGTGLAGSDLRNNYLYSEKLTIAQVHGTTAIIGTTNFLIATLIRVQTKQISIPDLTPLIYVIPFILIGSLIGKKILYKINKKYTEGIILLTMLLIIIFLLSKIINL